jgi:hypothetical protein
VKELLAQILLSAADAMWTRQPTLGQYTPETREREPDLTTHYAHELFRWFPWLHLNFDLIKAAHGDCRPDISVHRRRSNAANFLVIEVKRASHRAEVPADLEQIRDRWFRGNLRYRYGASLILDEAHHNAVEVRVMFRDRPQEELMRRLAALPRRLLPPEPPAVQQSPLAGLVDQIVAAKQADPNADTATLEREIDRQVYTLFGLPPEEMQIVQDGAAP